MKKRNLMLGVVMGVFFLLWSPYAFALDPAPDRFEPNDSFGTATQITLGQIVTATIAPKKDYDYFKLNIPKKGTFTAVVSEVPKEIDPWLAMYDSRQGWMKSARGNYGQGVTIQIASLPAGDYYLQLCAQNEGQSTQAYKLTTDLIPEEPPKPPEPDRFEPNDSFATATQITLGQVVTATIAPKKDYDYYKFNIPKKGTFTAVVSEVPKEIDPWLAMYDNNKGWMRSARGNYGQGVSIQIASLPAGDYYLQLCAQNEGQSTQAYKLTTDLIPEEPTKPPEPDRFEPNDSFATATQITLGQVVTATIAPKKDYDYYKINIPKKGTFTAVVSEVPKEIDPWLAMYDSRQGWMRSARGNYGQGVSIQIASLPAGDYYLQLCAQNEGQSGQAYKLTTDLMPEEPPKPPEPDRFEPNDSFATATQIILGQVVTATIAPKKDYDYFKLNIPKKGTFTAVVSEVPKEIDPWLAMYDNNKGWMKSARGNYGQGVSIQIASLPAGDYYLRLCAQNEGQSPQAYKLTTDLIPEPEVPKPDLDKLEPNDSFDQATKIELGQVVTATIVPQGDYDYFKLNIPKPGVFTVVLSEVSAEINPYLCLYDANKNQIKDNAPDYGKGATIQLKLVSAGDYYLRVSDWNDDGQTSQPYKITTSLISDLQPDALEPNNSFATATQITLGEVVTSTIAPTKDYDYFKLNIPKPGVFTAVLSEVPAEINPYLVLYDANKNQIKDNAPDYGKGATIQLKLVSAGDYYLRVSDWNDDGQSDQAYKITTSFSSFDTTLPLAKITSPQPNSIIFGTVTISGTATGESLSYVVQYGPGSLPISWLTIATSTTKVINGTLALWNTLNEPDGPYTFRLQVTDKSGNIATDTVIVGVDNYPPVAKITSPTNNSTIPQSTITITGTADDTHLLNWALEYGFGETPQTYTLIASSTTKVISDTLGTIYLPLGSYTLRLTAKDITNKIATQSVSFVITESLPTPDQVLQKVVENFAKINDLKAKMTSWGSVGTQTFPEVEEIFMMKKPDKMKVISPAKEEIMIINGELMYYLSPTFGTLTMGIDEYSNIKPSQLNFYYYPSEFQEKHTIEIKNHNDNFYILEAIPKEPNWNYEKLVLEIDYQKGIDTKTEVYIKSTETTTLGMIIEVKNSQLVNGIWVPIETVKKVFLEEGIVSESNMQLHDIQINTGISDNEFTLK